MLKYSTHSNNSTLKRLQNTRQHCLDRLFATQMESHTPLTSARKVSVGTVS